MMGPSHAATGAAAWLALTGSLSPVEALHMPPEIQLLGALTTAGAALISDWDHPRATVAHALPPVTEWISRVVSRLSGGHRQGTHSILGVAAFTAVAVLAAIPQVEIAGHTYAPGQGIIAAFLVAVAAKALRLLPARGVLAGWALGAAVAVLGTVLGGGLWWIPASVAIGVSVHILGDALTAVGVPLLWPLYPGAPVRNPLWTSSGRFRLPLLGATGSWREWLVVTVITAFAVVRAVDLAPAASRAVVALL
ncbi:metal-dependent hydrolase [Micrococcus sp.]|uniref:metal-dependent hydrolase n=1 Tax=Micrococcus sp. TaxID=1271 RepID=UPI002A910C3C|nr:metal-dependent hydrolase [Micrococcus sp.]MDY6054519.1 metal-dependent hydrolase [Micrococcus sp.]